MEGITGVPKMIYIGGFIMDSFSSSEAKKKLDALIDGVNNDGEPAMLRSKKRNEAILMSKEDFDWLQAIVSVALGLTDDDHPDFFEDDDLDHRIDVGPKPQKTDFIQVFQLKVTLSGIRPPIWRRIQVPANYSFWDLHVTIQDAMGWFDSHLHEFHIHNPSKQFQERIGIPLDEDVYLDDEATQNAGWTHFIASYFSMENPKAVYVYDFGDDWEHAITLEKILPREKGITYPVCLKGKRACPPEDCGGVGGYKGMLKIIADPEHEEYDEWKEWVGEDYDPETFDAASVVFDDPGERWDYAFNDTEEF